MERNGIFFLNAHFRDLISPLITYIFNLFPVITESFYFCTFYLHLKQKEELTRFVSPCNIHGVVLSTLGLVAREKSITLYRFPPNSLIPRQYITCLFWPTILMGSPESCTARQWCLTRCSAPCAIKNLREAHLFIQEWWWVMVSTMEIQSCPTIVTLTLLTWAYLLPPASKIWLEAGNPLSLFLPIFQIKPSSG